MIADCENGKIDLILTKEVSRFARNTVDTLEYTRRLKEYGVGVYFINDNIDTRQNDGEFRLSIMASVAQEESRKISERSKWGQKIAMEKGVVFGNNSIYGYDLKNGKLTVCENEAETVRLIYNKYVYEGKGTHVIARELYEEGIDPPKSEKSFWSSTMILRILRNEKYVGDLLQKKYITKNYLTHKKELNDGFEDKIYIKNHHEPIVDRDTWNRAQTELERRSVSAEQKKKYSNRYWCSGKIICSDCGSRYIIRKNMKKSGVYITWSCRERAQHGNRRTDARGNTIGCNMRMINNKSLLSCMKYVTEQINSDFDTILDEVINTLSEIYGSDNNTALCERKLEAKIKSAESKKEKMLDSFFGGIITKDEMTRLKERYDSELEQLKKELADLQNTDDLIALKTADINKLRDMILKNAVYSEEVYGEILDTIIVHEDYLLIKLKYLDFCFKLTYSTHDYKENYTTVIESCETVSLDETDGGE